MQAATRVEGGAWFVVVVTASSTTDDVDQGGVIAIAEGVFALLGAAQ